MPYIYGFIILAKKEVDIAVGNDRIFKKDGHVTNGKTSIVLIGMSGAGKSYFGEKLAKALKLPFIDSDDVILRLIRPLSQDFYCLKNYVEEVGEKKFLDLEEEVLIELAAPGRRVIAAGSSASYSGMAMEELRKTSLLLFLDDTPDELLCRIPNLEEHHFIGLGMKTFEEHCIERSKIYRKYTDLIIVLKDIQECNVLNVILQRLDGYIEAIQPAEKRSLS